MSDSSDRLRGRLRGRKHWTGQRSELTPMQEQQVADMAAALREGAKRLGHEPGWTNYECEDYLRALADELEGKDG